MPNDYINQVNVNGTDYDVVLGNIQKDGTLQTSDITIASGDKLVVTDSSNSNKVARASLSFGSSTTTFLANNGTWLTPAGTSSSDIYEVEYSSTGLNRTFSAISSAISSGLLVYLKITEDKFNDLPDEVKDLIPMGAGDIYSIAKNLVKQLVL